MAINYNVQPNSHKYRKEQKLKGNSEKTETKKIEAVVTNGAKTKKKSELTKLSELANIDEIKDTMVMASKKALSELFTKGIDVAVDTIKNCIDIAIYGEAQPKKKSGVGSKVSYGSYYDKPVSRTSQSGVKNVFDYDDVIFETRGDAELVLDAMCDIIDQYGIVSVGDLYELSEITTSNYMVNNYGWKDLSRADTVRVSEGYMIKLPRAVAIK